MRQELNPHTSSLKHFTVQMYFLHLRDIGDKIQFDVYAITAAIVSRRSSPLSSFILPLLFNSVSNNIAKCVGKLTLFAFLLGPLLMRRISCKKKAAIGIVILPEALHCLFLLVCSRLAFTMAFIVARKVCLRQLMEGFSVCHDYYLEHG